MELQSISRQSIAITQLVRAQVGTGRITLPVSSNRIYANLKHITGVGGGPHQPAFSLTQLRNLDNLIDRLKLLKGEGEVQLNPDDYTPDGINRLIDKYRQELYNELHKNNPYYTGMNASGLSLDIFI